MNTTLASLHSLGLYQDLSDFPINEKYHPRISESRLATNENCIVGEHHQHVFSLRTYSFDNLISSTRRDVPGYQLPLLLLESADS